jgi:hypothetical protein
MIVNLIVWYVYKLLFKFHQAFRPFIGVYCNYLNQVLSMECTICGKTSQNLAFSARGFEVMECSSCHYGQVFPLPDVDSLVALYNSKEYFATHVHHDFSKLTDADIKQQTALAG